MKKIFLFMTVLIGSVALILGCKKIINKIPEDYLSNENALTTVEGLETAVVGTYNSLQNGDLYGGSIWTCQDMLANNVKPSGQGNIVYEETQMLKKNMSPDNRLSASFWANAYYSINMANTIIEAIPEVNPSPTVADRILGECLFIRAMVNFDLVRYIGNINNNLGVPLLTAPTGITGKPSRATIEAVYQQIITDLLQAAQLLPETNNNRATSWSAKGLLSRVYFYHGDMDECITISTEIIDSHNFSLVDSVEDNWVASSTMTSEMLFALMSTTTNATAGTLNGYFRLASNGKFSPSTSVLKVFTFTGGNADQRYRKFFLSQGGKYFCTMFDDRYMNVPLVRLAEIYLNRAEARFGKGDTQGALLDLNMVRKRAGIPDTTNINATLIYYERFKELCFQGDNFFNQKRLKKEKISDKELPYNSVRLMYLIPQREMDVNPNLVQNTGN
jgi:hypothetical protein